MEIVKEKNPSIRQNRFKLYKAKKNMVTDLICISKKSFYSDFFSENKSNLKKTWEGIGGLINVNKKANSNKLIVHNEEVTDPADMASSINNFFVNIGKSLDQKIPQSINLFSDFLGDMNPCCITLNPCTDAEISELVSGVNWSKASSPYSIPSNIVKSFILVT